MLGFLWPDEWMAGVPEYLRRDVETLYWFTRGSLEEVEESFFAEEDPDPAMIEQIDGFLALLPPEAPIQSPQHNAGSGPSSADPSASDTPSEPAPRG